MSFENFVEDRVTRAREEMRTSSSCALLPPPAAVPGRFDAWSVMLDVYRHGGVDHWTLSIKLMTPSSTIRDWRIHGQIVAAVVSASGYPQSAPLIDPIIPVEEAHPTATLWWTWHGDGSAITPMSASVFKEVISAMTPRDPQWKGTGA